jgi:hypothetical protein
VFDTTTSQRPRQELAHRTGDGIEVTLLWCAADDSLSITVIDHVADEVFELGVPQDRAIYAYNHPYAFAAEQGLDYNLVALAAA